ncbi:phage portal protein family protein [Trichormus azollae]
MSFSLVFCEKFGMPTAVGMYAPTKEEQNKLLNALRALA